MLDATERRALTLTVFTAACLCFAPAEFISGAVLLLLSIALYAWDTAVTRREAAAQPPAQPAGAQPAGAPAPAPPAPPSPE